MILYRSISPNEFMELIKGKRIDGRFYCSVEQQTTCSLDCVVSFFINRIFWRDSKHGIFIRVDIPEERLVTGIGTYYAAKSFRKTKVWTGRKGKHKYELEEAYTHYYSIEDVREIAYGDIFANWYVKKHINPLLEELHSNYDFKVVHTYHDIS